MQEHMTSLWDPSPHYCAWKAKFFSKRKSRIAVLVLSHLQLVLFEWHENRTLQVSISETNVLPLEQLIKYLSIWQHNKSNHSFYRFILEIIIVNWVASIGDTKYRWHHHKLLSHTLQIKFLWNKINKLDIFLSFKKNKHSLSTFRDMHSR